MPKRFLVSCLVAFFSLATLAHADEWHKEYSLTGRPELRVSTDDASVTIAPWDKNTIAVQIHTDNWKIGSGELEISEHQSENVVEVTLREHPHYQFFSTRHRRAEVQVHMPVDAILDITTHDGSLNVDRMKGDFKLRTGDGRLTARDVDGKLAAATGDGHLEITGRFDQIDAKSGDGRMEIEVLPGSKMSAGWSFRSGDGGIRLRLPKDLAANVEAHTGDGHLDLDIPITTSGRVGGHDLRGVLNGGGPTLSLRSGDGSIHVTT